ncbi:MAG TPA: hypothetical protein VNK52_04545 [Hyphomicrobiaceae bacterium]|nr:hypothetical protein [Hyphomicrobiaceae bacterium]
MIARNDRAAELEALGRVLDAFGSDQSRWPAGAADRFRSLLVEVPAARALVAEARALERVLDRAPRPSREAMDAMADRIVAAAAGSSGQRERSAPVGGARVIALPAVLKQVRRGVAADRTVWQTAALLAACLVAGVYLGASPAVAPVVQDFAESLGVAGDLDSTAYALFDESLEEDTL